MRCGILIKKYLIYQLLCFCGPNRYISDKFNSVFVLARKMFGVVLNAIQFLVWPKILVVAKNILGYVEGQGILYVV